MNTTSFFDNFFKNATYNGILIMDKQGCIIKINKAFTRHFGYDEQDLKGKNFSTLFIDKDRQQKKPERELEKTIAAGSANDENYIVHKEGNKVWVTGESVLMENDAETFLVKVIHNIHAQKQLERFLLQSHEFIDTIFDSIQETGLLMLDTSLHVLNVNSAFLKIFDIDKPPAENSKFSEITNPFFQRQDVRQELINFVVMNRVVEEKIFELDNVKGSKKISLQGKLLEETKQIERKLLVIIKEVDF